jgi:hypothetical protein
LNISALIDRATINFSPCVCFKGQILGTNSHFGWHTATSQQAGCYCGTLQAKHALWVPGTSVVDSPGDLINHLY